MQILLHRTLREDIDLRVRTAPHPAFALVDLAQLESAILNLALNAQDAMPRGGTLTLAIEEIELDADSLGQASDVRDGRYVSIGVTDDGTGMDSDTLARVFEPFFTTKEAGRGTGLGLSTVYGFVKQSKGAIAIESSPGAGTTVTLYIPRPWETAPASGVEDEAAHVLRPGLKVLLVEDDAEVRNVVRTFLTQLGCEVAQVTSAEQALLTLGPQARFDLLLSDIALGPGMRGTQLAAEAQRRHPELAILLMSAELLEADRDSPASWELLRKPYTRAELARAIAKVTQA
jgi:CheY-like chemotaxis protein